MRGNHKIVFFDLETLPNLQEALKVWTQLGAYPFRTMKATVTSIICAGWKYYGDKKTHCINAWDFPAWNKDVNNDKAICGAIYEILKDVDVIVTHNGKRFDFKFLQTRLMINGYPPLPNINHIDTVELARKNLFAFSNRLGDLGKLLANDNKLQNGGWKLWVNTHAREPKAMRLMERYCKQDVRLLEKVFKRLLPFAKGLPNQNRFRSPKQLENGVKVCPNCGSDKLRRNGYRHTATQSYQRLRCDNCGSSSRTDAKEKNPRII